MHYPYIYVLVIALADIIFFLFFFISVYWKDLFYLLFLKFSDPYKGEVIYLNFELPTSGYFQC